MDTFKLGFHLKDKEKAQQVLDHLNASSAFSVSNQTTEEKADYCNMVLRLQFYKERFLVKGENRLHPISCASIAYFFSKEGHVYIQTKQGTAYKYNATLYTIAKEVNPKQFYLINRSVLVAYDSIAHIECNEGRLYLTLSPCIGETVMVSRERISSFKAWLEL